MTISAGSRLGPYEVLTPLGAGGMGEVYKARDSRLERTVAIKVLPEHLSSSAEGRQRFEREAKTISQLSHPHICALYDVGNQDGVEFLVMEYLEGETLSERLVKRPLPLEQTVRFGTQIADALDKAHRQGIVHRDLKPGNVMLTNAGVKLLDFGLAKAIPPASASVEATSLPPTIADAGEGLTQEGTILGTFHYMSPEQLEGKPVDARTDIFAFGCVLYEMATARKAFSGQSRASLVSAIMTSDPAPISSLQPMSPPALDRIVKTCLAKDPEERWQSARDIERELQWIAEKGSVESPPTPEVARLGSRERLAWAVAAALFLASVLAAFGYLRRAPAPPEPFRMCSFLTPPEGQEFVVSGVDSAGSLTVSPDGRRVTFSTKGPDGKTRLWLRNLDEFSAQPIPGTEGGRELEPFWSPDSRFLAFFAEGRLKKVDLAGSPPVTLCDAVKGRSGGWSRDGVILFSPDANSAICRVPAAGGEATEVTKLDSSHGETTHRWASFLPDGRHFLYMAGSHGVGATSELNAIYLGTLDSSERTLLFRARSNVVYASGHLLYIRGNVLLAQPFDVGRARLSGDPRPLAGSVVYDVPIFHGEFSVSENGVLVYAQGAYSAARLSWRDRSGKRLGDPVGEPAIYLSFRLAPDGKRVAARIQDPAGEADFWVLDSRGVRNRLTFGGVSEGGGAISPVWSPDGSRIVYGRAISPRKWGIYLRSSDGAAPEDLLYGPTEPKLIPTDWSSDGRFLSFDVSGEKRKNEVWILPTSGDRKAFRLLESDFDKTGWGFSPDGRWFLYSSNESGKNELYVTSFPEAHGKWQVSTDGTQGGRWFRGGREILHISQDGNVLSVEFEAGQKDPRIGPPKFLFRSGNWAWADGSRDGERLLVAEIGDVPEKPRVALVANWTAGLAKK